MYHCILLLLALWLPHSPATLLLVPSDGWYPFLLSHHLSFIISPPPVVPFLYRSCCIRDCFVVMLP